MLNTKTLEYFTDSGGSQTHTPKGGKANAQSSESKSKISPREEVILLTLAERELYGLEIVRAIKESSFGAQTIRVGTLYPTLHNLEQKELVTSRWGDEVPDERCGARRRYYRLTEEGNRAVGSIISFRNNLLAWRPKQDTTNT